MGGSAAFLAACRVPGLAAAVCYYGGVIGKFADEKPKCPLKCISARKTESIPDGRRWRRSRRSSRRQEIYVYPDAPHAFSNDDRPSFRKEATDLAWKRTQEFLAKHMKK
jgi:carboxymethylenebutenolidase